MRFSKGMAWLLAAAIGIVGVADPSQPPLAAQDAGDDGSVSDDDSDEVSDSLDGGDIGDPDDLADPGEQDAGDVDIGDIDPVDIDPVDDDAGADADISDNDIAGDDAGDDDADDAGDDDTGDDDTGDDDTGDDENDRGVDDDVDDNVDDNDDDDAGGGDSSAWEVAEAEAERAELDERDRIDTDRDGFRYRRGEFIALDLSADDLAELRGNGFELIASEKLAAVSGTLLLLRGPVGLSDEASLDAIGSIFDPDSFGYNHLFDSSAVQTRRKRGGTVPQRFACGCKIGLIDTGVASGLQYFKHVSLVQRAFNGKVVRPQLHGTAVAHLMAGTKNKPSRLTKIYVADIFSGPRATSGSSYALIKALDWMAAQGVPVINVSLSGPRNPAVASAVARIARRGHVIVAAAGNDGPAAPPVFPGAYNGVIGVTAVDGEDRVYRYANRGDYVHFSALGVAVTAIDAKGAVRDATGTSFAAPVIAARLAAQLRTPDSAAAQRAIQALEAEARDLGPKGRDPIYGAGLIRGQN